MGGNLSPIGLALQPNPMLAQLLSLNRLVTDTGVKRVSWNNLFALPRNKAILFELLSWEMYYHRTQQLQEELAASEPGSHEYIATDNRLQITQDAMDHFELEMRISTMPLSELTPETDLKDIFNHLKLVSINAEEE